MIVAVLWAAFGMTIGAAVLHATLGLARPWDRTHLSFACMMVMLTAYGFFEAELYRATTSAEAVEMVRMQVASAHGFIGFALVFVPAYTHVRVPRWLGASCAIGLAALFVANLIAANGVWFSGTPRLVPYTASDGTAYAAVVAPPPGLLQFLHYAYVLAVFAVTFTCALKQVRRGERRRGLILAVSLVVVILHHVVDIIREAVGGAWSYSDEFGLIAWAMLMSVQLGIDYRTAQQGLRRTLRLSEQHANALARTAEAALHVRDKLNTPLQTLELSLAARVPRTSEDYKTLVDLYGAVTEISELSLAVERTTADPGALAALERAS